MGLHNSLASSIALATLGSIGALATTAPYCVGSGSSICFKWGVPETAISSGTGNIYFQLRAPSSYSWAALGTGSRMSGSSMFLMYQDGAGNVTLSTRTGTGHTMPKYSRRSVTLLAGSGVVNGEMVANVQCADCTSVSLKGSSSWLSAWKAGGAINSKDASAAISQHDDTSTFQVDLSQASIKSDSNPFTSDGSNNGGLSNGGLGPGGIISGGGGSGLLTPTLRQAHGILMMIVWVVLYPLGALLMPVLGKWLLHASFQTIAFLAMWIGLGMGYILASRLGLSQSTHSRLGIAVCALMFLQPIFGALHHANFKRKGRRGAFSHIHVWYGRALIILGIINGGLGLQLANTGMSLRVAYIALCAAIGAPFLLSIPWIERRKAKEARKQSVKRRRQARIATSDRSSSR